MSLGARIQKLEAVAAPIKADQERRRKNRELRELIFSERKDYIEGVLAPSKYALGDDLNEEETTKDIIEIDLLYHHEATERFGTGEDGNYKATLEQLNEIMRETACELTAIFMAIIKQLSSTRKNKSSGSRREQTWNPAWHLPSQKQPNT